MNLSGIPLVALLLLFSTAAPGCKTGQKTAVSSASKGGNGKSLPQITSVRMGRGACFGKCPVYDLELFQDGRARYYGRMFVEKEGIYEKQLDKAAVSEVLQSLSAARPDTMQKEYERAIADLPSINYTISYTDGKAKNIQNAQDGPQVLSRIARDMDKLVQQPDFNWKKIADKVARGQ